MSKVHEFSFSAKSIVEEIKVDGHTFTIDLSDESIRKIQASIFDFAKGQKEIELELKKATTPKELEDALEKAHEMFKSIVETILVEDNAYDTILELSGKSIIRVGEFIAFLSNIVAERTKQQFQNKKQKYVKNKGK